MPLDRSKSKIWEKIAFRVGAAFLLPLLFGAFALQDLSARFLSLSEKKESLGRLWSGAHAGEARALLQLAKLRMQGAALAIDASGSQLPQARIGLRDLKGELEQLDKLRNRVAAMSGVSADGELGNLAQQLLHSASALDASLEKLFDSTRRQSAAEAQSARRELDRISLEGESGLGRLRARHELYEQQSFAAFEAEAEKLQGRLNFYLFLLAALSLAAGAFLVFTIVGPLGRISARVGAIAAGEGGLTARVPAMGAGEVKELVGALNHLLERREATIGAISHASEVVGSTTERVAQHTNQLIVTASGINKNIMEQSMNLDEATNSLGSIDDLLSSAGESTRQAASLSKIAMDRAHQGGASVHETISAIEKIEESSQKVEQLVISITDIASQTNLLAINAAIEATKAGEHGKGFAVVAEEVRKLAERSRKLTAEVTTHITESSNRVKVGVGLAKGAGKSLDGIIKDVEAVASLIQRIAASAAKQSESSSVILQFMQNLSANVRTNLDELRKVNRSTELTSQEVLRLEALVNQLNSILGPIEIDPAKEYAEAMAAQEALAARRAGEEQRSRELGVSLPAGLAPLPAGADTFEEEDAGQDPSALLESLRTDEITLSMDVGAPEAPAVPSTPPPLPSAAPKLPGIPERPRGGEKKGAA